MMKQKILAVLTSLCIGVLPLAAGMAAAPGTTAIENTFATKCSKKDLPILIWWDRKTTGLILFPTPPLTA